MNVKNFLKFIPSLASLIAANAVVASWALYADIRVENILFLYFVETWILGFFNFFKTLKASAPNTPKEERMMRIQFLGGLAKDFSGKSLAVVFVAQLFLVITVYGAALFGFLVPMIIVKNGIYWDRVFSVIPAPAQMSGFMISVTALFVSHGISYMVNFIGKQEFLRISPARQMGKLGGRLAAMHFFVILGAMFWEPVNGIGLLFGSATAGISSIIFIKILADAGSHLAEHFEHKFIGPAEGSRPEGKITTDINFFTKRRPD